MYGLVKQGFEHMVCQRYGEDAWSRIQSAAGVDIEIFIGMHVYPDEMAFSLFQSASAVLEVPLAELLRSFGAYWLTFTALSGHDHLLDMAGSSLAEFLENLDTVHSVLVEGFPEMKAPTFTYDQVGPAEFDLHYHSERRGLAHMVIGLVSALAERFGDRVEITHEQVRDDTHDHDILRIRMLDGDGQAAESSSETNP